MSSLPEQLIETLEFFNSRKTVGVMKTEHSVFIPTELLNSSEDTKKFIILARKINGNEEWNCSVDAVKHDKGNDLIKGIEFVFEFTQDTKFEEIITYLRKKV